MNLIWIIGAPGTGKSTLVQRMPNSVDIDQIGIGYRKSWIVPLPLVRCALAQGFTAFAGVCDNLRDILRDLIEDYQIVLFVMDADATPAYRAREKRGWEAPPVQKPVDEYVNLGKSLGLLTYRVARTQGGLIHADGSAPFVPSRLAFPTPRYLRYGWCGSDTPKRDFIVAKYLTLLEGESAHLESLAKRSIGKGDSWNLVVSNALRSLFRKAKEMYERRELEAERDYKKIEKAVERESNEKEEVAND